MTTHVHVQQMPAEGAICDFCNSPDVHWSFPARDFTRHSQVGITGFGRDSVIFDDVRLHSTSHGGWAACNVCYRLIIAGKRRQLARRSTARSFKRFRDEEGYDLPIRFEDVLVMVRNRQDEFWANRKGPPIYHAKRPTK